MESAGTSAVRRVSFSGPGGTLETVYDPAAERFLSRTWNGTEQEIEHLLVEGGAPATTLLQPLTLFGSEAMTAGT